MRSSPFPCAPLAGAADPATAGEPANRRRCRSSRTTARARAEQAQKRPIFVDAWAPWCHTCRFLRAYVFTDAALAKQAGRFVWLSIDTEKDRNAPFLAKFPVDVWPTLMVIDG